MWVAGIDPQIPVCDIVASNNPAKCSCCAVPTVAAHFPHLLNVNSFSDLKFTCPLSLLHINLENQPPSNPSISSASEQPSFASLAR